MSNKAKRIIKEFDFESEGASVHLVSKKQGGAANGFKTLIMKSQATEELPDIDEDIAIKKKLEQVTVTMSMEEFLRKFFDMYYYDAELLTAMLGFETEAEADVESSEPFDYSSYLKEKVSSFEIMKSMHEGSLESFTASDYVTILEYQEKIEKQLNEEMMDKITIEKSRLEALEVAEQELATKVELVKSLEAQVAENAKELDAIKKAQADADLDNMKGRLKDLVDEEKVERMAKSLLVMDNESVEDILNGLSEAKSKIEKSNLFEETSVEGEAEQLTKEQEFEARLAKSLAGE